MVLIRIIVLFLLWKITQYCDIIRLKRLEIDVDVILMILENAELKYIERIVAISKRAFETDIEVGGTIGDYPPEYDSVIWHKQMLNGGHLFQAVTDGEIVGA